VQDVTERVLWEQSERQSREWLERRVGERTRELDEANRQLQAEVTIRKRAQEEAAQARNAQASFLASMSHEIRTPLNVILGYSQVLQQQLMPGAREHEALRGILESGRHLLSLVGEVVDLSKIEAGRVDLTLGDFNLGSLISSLSFMFRNKCEKKGLELRIEGLGARPWWVRGDEGKLRQVLINLLGNAVKFTEQGEVRLRVVPEEQGGVRFEVIDTGIGIPDEAHASIFDRFSQTPSGQRAEGAGLGLAISRRLVEVMGGTLEVRSSPGWGSNFYFSLRFEAPLAVRPSETRAYSPRIRIASETPCRALVVDDLEANRNVMKQLLEALGCSVAIADSGRAALAQAERGGIDIVFLDVLMPGLDGIETAQALRRTRQLAPKLVASSASVLGTQREAYLAAGFDDFVPKPFRTEQITDCLANLLKVRFVTDDFESPLPAALAGLAVPEDVIHELRDAAELYQVTLLRAALSKLEVRGNREQALAERLKERAAIYDMPGILRLLEQVTISPGRVSG
jgi:signal transduction histidine kinase/DNA-binding response OmpR family regulator